jgi:flavin-dependent dehydrogenase
LVESEWKKWRPETKSYFNEIDKGETIIGSKKRVYHIKPGVGYILNRPEFICQLARKAEKLGVIIQTNNKIKTINDLDGEFVVDASGCPSTIKRNLGINSGIKGVTYQQTIENSNCFVSDTLKVIYLGNLGYYWIFPRDPKKKEINIGVGFSGKIGYNLKNILEKFKEERKIEGMVNYVTGGLIPLGLQQPLIHDNILFVGDAGVGTFPFTGQGIYRALISGDVAGRCIARGYSKKYPHIINQKFIKWDLIGKIFIRTSYVFRRINPKLVLASLNYFADASNMIH